MMKRENRNSSINSKIEFNDLFNLLLSLKNANIINCLT
jgi:hypothetical protein